MTEDIVQCDWNRGPDPASGCDNEAVEDGLCAKHLQAYKELMKLPED